MITSKDQNITKAHARYLEARLIGIAHLANRARLDNLTAPPPLALPEADCSDMEFFIEQIRLILPVLGLEFFRESAMPSAIGDLTAETPAPVIFALEHKKTGVSALAREIDGNFVVLKGSRANQQWTQSSTALGSYGRLHQQLMQSGILEPDTTHRYLQFNQDVEFSSPSAAAAVVIGRNANGRLEWRVKDSATTYAAWQDEQISSFEQAVAQTLPTCG